MKELILYLLIFYLSCQALSYLGNVANELYYWIYGEGLRIARKEREEKEQTNLLYF